MGPSKNPAIWARQMDPEILNRFTANSMVDHLGIQFTEVGPDFVKATMPVDERTVQPFGVLHGGASVALSETLGSAASYGCVDDSKICVGIEINANHVRQAKSGMVEGVARPVHVGSTLQVWQTYIHDAEDRLISTGRITIAVLERRR